MQTLLLSSDTQSLKRAAALLRAGELVAFPTETVYGLGAPIFNATAGRAVFRAKGRPADNPLIAHCAERAEVSRLADHIPPLFDILYDTFSPGPLTMLLKKRPTVPVEVTAGLPTVAVRFPAHPIAQELIRLAGEPLVAPSANTSGRPSPTTARHVLDDLYGRIAAVLDGGTCSVGIESTVVNILADPPVILRPGSVTKEALEEATGKDFIFASSVMEHSPLAPGMKYRHYAPNAAIVLADSINEALTLANEALFSHHILSDSAARKNVWILTASPDIASAPPSEAPCVVRFLSEQTLYALFRAADAENVGLIIIAFDSVLKNNTALLNRIEKAACGR